VEVVLIIGETGPGFGSLAYERCRPGRRARIPAVSISRRRRGEDDDPEDVAGPYLIHSHEWTREKAARRHARRRANC
jgi:hypothetical protein